MRPVLYVLPVVALMASPAAKASEPYALLDILYSPQKAEEVHAPMAGPMSKDECLAARNMYRNAVLERMAQQVRQFAFVLPDGFAHRLVCLSTKYTLGDNWKQLLKYGIDQDPPVSPSPQKAAPAASGSSVVASCTKGVIAQGVKQALETYKSGGLMAGQELAEKCYKVVTSIVKDQYCACSALDGSFVLIDKTATEGKGLPRNSFFNEDAWVRRHLKVGAEIGLDKATSNTLLNTTIDGISAAIK